MSDFLGAVTVYNGRESPGVWKERQRIADLLLLGFAVAFGGDWLRWGGGSALLCAPVAAGHGAPEAVGTCGAARY